MGVYEMQQNTLGRDRMNEFEKFMETLYIMEFHLNDDTDSSLIVNKWIDELNQTLKMYMDKCQINAGNVIGKTKIKDDPYYGKEGPK